MKERIVTERATELELGEENTRVWTLSSPQPPTSLDIGKIYLRAMDFCYMEERDCAVSV